MIRVAIIDDERLARAELKRLLKNHSDVEVVGEFSNADDLFYYLRGEESPDVIFLDIQMPGLSGIEAARKFDENVKFVFCTAYTEFAVEAFELEAVDYLLKPVRDDRISQALSRCRPIEESGKISCLSDDYRLLLRFGSVKRFVRLDQVERLEVVGNDTTLFTPYGKSYLRSPLSSLVKKLDPAKFFRASRSEVIRVDKVKQLKTGGVSTSAKALMSSGDEVKVSRRQSAKLKELFDI